MLARQTQHCSRLYCSLSKPVDYHRPTTSGRAFEIVPSSCARSRSSDEKLLHQGWCVRSPHPGALRTIGVSLQEPSFAKSMYSLLVLCPAECCEWSIGGT